MKKDARLDFVALHDEAVRENRYGECPSCEGANMLLCWCGVCLKYCHNDYCHEPFDEPPDEALMVPPKEPTHDGE